MKTLLTLALILVMAGSAWGGSFGYDVAEGPGALVKTFSGWELHANKGATTASLVFTATGGETLDSFHVRLVNNGVNDSSWIAIYEVEDDSLNDRVYLDTLTTAGAGGDTVWADNPDGISGFVFEAGVTYGLAVAPMNTEFQAQMYDLGAAGDSEWDNMDSRTEPPDPRGNEGTDQTHKFSMSCWYTEAGGEPASLPVGAATVGGTTVGSSGP